MGHHVLLPRQCVLRLQTNDSQNSFVQKTIGWDQRPREYLLYLEYLDFIMNMPVVLKFVIR